MFSGKRPIKAWLERISKGVVEAQTGMRILVGIPVFRVAELAQLCLSALVCTPATVLVIDNAADANVKDVIRAYGDRVRVIQNDSNKFCNGGWNQVMEYGLNHGYDIVGLGSSDVILHAGWYEKILQRAQMFKNEVWIPKTGTASDGVIEKPNLGWYFSFLPKEAVRLVYPIPETLKHWFGDTYMEQTLARNGWKHVLLNSVGCIHEQSAVTFRVPEAYPVIEQDKIAWKEFNDNRLISLQ